MHWAIFLAGLFLFLKDFIPWQKAQRTGETRTRAYNSKVVRRADEPDRFEALQKNLTGGMIVGLLTIGVAFAWYLFGIISLVLLVPIGMLMAANQKRARQRTKAILDEFS